MLFVVTAISLIFVAVWIIKSEARIKFCRAEIKRLKSQVESGEREKFTLLEKLDSVEKGEDDFSGSNRMQNSFEKDEQSKRLKEALKQNTALEKETKKLKAELDEAKKSLEEVYKALST